MLVKKNILGTSPCSSVAIRWKAPRDKSIEFPLVQVGHASAIVTMTVWIGSMSIDIAC